MREYISRETYKKLTHLNTKRYREESASVFDILVEGERLVRQLLIDGIPVKCMYISDKRIDNFADIISMSKTTVYQLTDSQAEALSDTKNGSGLFARIEFKTRPIENYKKLIYLNAISDPGNIGTILRCGRAFGVDGIVLDKSCCDLTNPKVVRSSLGAVFTVPTALVDEGWLSSRSEQLILSDLRGGVAINRFEFPSEPYIVVFGSEAVGISDEIQKLSHTLVHIPVVNEMESLNVGVAVGIFLHKMR